MRKFNISKPMKYTSNGVEKTYWANIGTMTEFDKPDGSVSRIIEIPAISLQAQIFPMKQESKPIAQQPVTANTQPERVEPEGEINPDDIPF